MDDLKSDLPYPPLHDKADFVVLSDWDGTITDMDSNDYLTDNLGMGKDERHALNLEVLAGGKTFRETFSEMLESVLEKGHKFEDCKAVLREHIRLDPGFKEFYGFCKKKGVPLIIVSSGMEPLIRAVLSNLIAEIELKDHPIEIISNSVEGDNDQWHIRYRNPLSDYGHDKSLAILPYRKLPKPPILFFFGDGVSDMSAARHADVLFVKNDKPEGFNDLAAYVKKEGIKHILIKSFADARPIVEDIVTGEKTVEQVLREAGNGE